MLFFIAGVCLSVGLYKLMAQALKIPKLKTSRAVMNIGRKDKKISTYIEAFLLDLANRLSVFIRMGQYRRAKLERDLKSAGIPMTPEAHIAFAILQGLFVALFALIFLSFFPLLSVIIVIFAIYTFSKEMGRVGKEIRKKREAIEDELPRFVATVEQELRSSRDILTIIENFRKSAGQEFAA